MDKNKMTEMLMQTTENIDQATAFLKRVLKHSWK